MVRFLDDPECQASTADPAVDAGHGRIETRTAGKSDRALLPPVTDPAVDL